MKFAESPGRPRSALRCGVFSFRQPSPKSVHASFSARFLGNQLPFFGRAQSSAVFTDLRKAVSVSALPPPSPHTHTRTHTYTPRHRPTSHTRVTPHSPSSQIGLQLSPHTHTTHSHVHSRSHAHANIHTHTHPPTHTHTHSLPPLTFLCCCAKTGGYSG